MDPTRALSLGELVSEINDSCFWHAFSCQYRLTQHHLGLPLAGYFLRSYLAFRDRETSELTHESKVELSPRASSIGPIWISFAYRDQLLQSWQISSHAVSDFV